MYTMLPKQYLFSFFLCDLLNDEIDVDNDCPSFIDEHMKKPMKVIRKKLEELRRPDASSKEEDTPKKRGRPRSPRFSSGSKAKRKKDASRRSETATDDEGSGIASEVSDAADGDDNFDALLGCRLVLQWSAALCLHLSAQKVAVHFLVASQLLFK